MSDYTQVTFFAPKDELASGNPSKLIKGAEVDPELAAISTAIASKFDSGDVSDNATAAALASDAVLITPAKLKYAVENGTLQLNLNALTTEASAAAAGDFVPVYDVSAAAVRKFTVTNLVAATGFVPNGRIITAGLGLDGTGDLSADRTLNVLAGAGLTFSGDDLVVGQGSGISVTADAVAVDRSNATTTDATGYMDMPQVTQTGNYTLVLTDRGKTITYTSGHGAGDTLTIPANSSVAFPLGTVIGIDNLDSNSLTIAITSDTLTLAGTTTTGSRTLGQNGMATIKKVTSTGWLIAGQGVS